MQVLSIFSSPSPSISLPTSTLICNWDHGHITLTNRQPLINRKDNMRGAIESLLESVRDAV
uniref:Uncharacterized protein n=1 Tax=Manihot esculenta TaxID=3983 RepID=A0A2C9VFK2_MANES